MSDPLPPPLPPLPSTMAGAFGRPFWNEGRAPLELAHLLRNPVTLAPGGGRRIVITTGFLAGAATAGPMASWLRRAGYRVDLAEVGRNAITSSTAVADIGTALARSTEPAVLIGHSRGGQQSRVAAFRQPDRVEQLITLGSPVRAHLPRQAVLRASVEAIRLMRFAPFGPNEDSDVEAEYEADLFAPFDVDVPWTTIWSKTDGVIEWQACLDEHAESKEITCSHTGMIASVASFRAIAEVLAR